VTNLVNTIVSPPAGPTGPTCVTLPNPVISATKSPADPTGTTWTFSVGNAATFPQGTTFTWNFGDGSPAQTGASVQHTYENNNLYTVTVTATHPNQCAPKTAQQNVPAFPDVETRVYAVKENGDIYIESDGSSEYIYLVFETYYPDMSKFSDDIRVDALIAVDSSSPLDLRSVPVWYQPLQGSPGRELTPSELPSGSPTFTLNLGSNVSGIATWLSEISGYTGPQRPQINLQPENRLDRYILKVPITGFSGEATVRYTVVAAEENNFNDVSGWLVGWGRGTTITPSD